MRMDVSGTIMVAVGAFVNTFEAYWITEHPNLIVAGVGTLVCFLGWVFIVSGVKNLQEVRKDKKARRKAYSGGKPGVPPSEMHLGMQEPPKQ